MSCIKLYNILFLVITFSLILNIVNSTILHLDGTTKQTKKVCFQEHLVGDSTIQVRIKRLDNSLGSINGNELKVKIKDIYGNHLKDDVLHALQSNVFFRTPAGGYANYEICISNMVSKVIPIEVSIDVDNGREEAEQVESKEHIDKIGNVLQQLKEQILAVSENQDYFKTREERFRQTTESTADRVFYVGLLQFLVLIGACVWQMTSLKSFFKKKKLL
ncbi:hypothetical protein ABK040_011529 [Willaertia magna]